MHIFSLAKQTAKIANNPKALAPGLKNVLTKAMFHTRDITLVHGVPESIVTKTINNTKFKKPTPKSAVLVNNKAAEEIKMGIQNKGATVMIFIEKIPVGRKRINR